MKDIWDALENEGHGERLEEEMFAFLSAYADDETDARERRLVEAYLREEPNAERLLGFIRSTDAALAADTVEPPNGLLDVILAKTTRKPVFLRGVPGRVVAVSGAVAALLAVVWSLKPDAPRSQIAALEPAPVARAAEEAVLQQPQPVPNASAEERTPEDLGGIAAQPPPDPGTRTSGKAVRLIRQTQPNEQRPKGAVPGFTGSRTMMMASNPTGSRLSPIPASFERPTPTVYSSEEPITVRAEPKPIDPMAIEQPSQDDQRASGNSGFKPKEKPPVLPDVRERLRETLQKANEERGDLNDSSLNAPQKKSGNTRGVTQ